MGKRNIFKLSVVIALLFVFSLLGQVSLLWSIGEQPSPTSTETIPIEAVDNQQQEIELKVSPIVFEVVDNDGDLSASDLAGIFKTF
ncbi:MAG: hypothetical protein PHX72_03050 [Candidatus Shapirobacteria bacterium]|nr:hypothetical protein [Candidatus Shapirobacteria bacterium]